MADWFPGKDAELYLFLTNLVKYIDEVTDELKLPKGTFDEAKLAAQDWLAAYAAREEAQQKLDTAFANLHKQAPLTEKAVRAAAKQIKGIINVPVEVLNLLQLLSTGEPTRDRVAAHAPVLDASVVLGKVLLKYKKLGHQGLRLYARRGAETTFGLLGTYTTTPLHDERPNLLPGQPEQREYYAVFVDKDQAVGEVSATVTVAVGAGPM